MGRGCDAAGGTSLPHWAALVCVERGSTWGPMQSSVPGGFHMRTED